MSSRVSAASAGKEDIAQVFESAETSELAESEFPEPLELRSMPKYPATNTRSVPPTMTGNDFLRDAEFPDVESSDGWAMRTIVAVIAIENEIRWAELSEEHRDFVWHGNAASMARSRIPESHIQAIRERAPIEEIVGEYAQLKPAGYHSLKGRSP